jgi:hypothetical protein
MITRRVNSQVNPSSASFRPNSGFSYIGLGIWRGSARKPLGAQHIDAQIGTDDSRVETDGGDVALSRGSQAEDKAQRPSRSPV